MTTLANCFLSQVLTFEAPFWPLQPVVCFAHQSTDVVPICYDIKPVRMEEGKSYWKIPLGDDDATREKNAHN